MKRSFSNRGFTIVELLIVIVIIGILAAITIVAYNGIQDRARISSVNSALSQSSKKLKLFQVDNPDTYPTAAGANGLDNLAALGITNTSDVTYQYSSSANTYCLTATNGTTSYKISNISTTATVGGCAGHGQGGVAAITNIIANPSFETTSGTSVTGVTSTPRATAETSNIGVISGSKSLKITPLYDLSNDNFVDIANPGFQVNTTYTLTATYTLTSPITSSVGTSPRFRFNIGSVDMSSSTTLPKTTGTYQISWTFNVGATNNVAFLRIMPGGKLGDPPVYFDNFMIVQGSTTPTYADGSSTNWVWNGTANNSSSTGPAL